MGAEDTSVPSNGIYYDLMDASMSLCIKHNMTPFYLFDQEVDEVIYIINFYIDKSKIKRENNSNKSNKQEEKRIRVTEKTATGGWY